MNFCLAFLLAAFRVIVIPTQFQDCALTASRSDIQSMLGEVSSYFNDQYKGADTFSFELAPTVTLSRNQAYYGQNSTDIYDKHISEAVTEACRIIAEDVDFAAFDRDEDGEVECVVLLTAGLSEADATAEENIWPQQDLLSSHGIKLSLSGKRIDNYIITPELWSKAGNYARLTGIGTLCHEFGHILGLPDYYDVDGEAGGRATAMWSSTALMDEGNLNDEGRTPPNFNALDLELLGLGICEPLAPGDYVLEPVNRNGRYLKAETGHEGEFFLFEARENVGRDAFIGGSGLLAYHIDKSAPDFLALWKENRINCRPEHQGAYVIAADPEAGSASDAFFPRGSSHHFTAVTDPSLSLWDGSVLPLAITGIALRADGSVGFRVIEPFTFTEILPFQDAIMLSWQTDPSLENSTVTVRWSCAGEEQGVARVSKNGHYTIQPLEPGTEYLIELQAKDDSGAPHGIRATETTKVRPKDSLPFIYLNIPGRNEDGSFPKGIALPLRIYNCSDIVNVNWYYNGISILPDADGYFHPTGSGVLKAVVVHSGSGPSILEKNIHLK